jgi:CO/xanthine dehydrogenase FAD-binding subunit
MDLNTIMHVATPGHRRDLPAWERGDAWLAGGTWLFSEPQPQLTRLIDLTSFRWPALVIGEQGLEIGATCRIAELDAAALPARWIAAPLINQCCRAFVASFKIWNMATVGGNLCLALPAGPMISLAAALEGTCTIWCPDGSERHVAAAEFVVAPERNALRPGELLRKIDLPASALIKRAAFRQTSLTPLGRSAALLIGTVSPPDGAFVLTVTASTPRPVQLVFPSIPHALPLRDAIEAKIPPASYFDDVHGMPAWRRHMTLRLAEETRQELAAGPSR